MSKEEINDSFKANVVVSVDPGREKCGVAVVQKPNFVLVKDIVATEVLAAAVSQLALKYKVQQVVLGNGTFSSTIQHRLEEHCEQKRTLNVITVDEYRTTDMARIRYWQENPPRGWRRLLPVTMQVIPVPVDDYVAVILAERYFAEAAKC